MRSMQACIRGRGTHLLRHRGGAVARALDAMANSHLRPRDLFDLLLYILLRALHIKHGGIERVMPHNLREPVERHQRGHAIPKAMSKMRVFA